MRGWLQVASLLPLLLVTTATAEPRPRWSALDDAAKAEYVARIHEPRSIPERLSLATEPFLGTPYAISPLGEGEGVDPDPRLRWDQADCLTFIETAMALAAAPSFDALVPLLDDVRYAEVPPSFLNRNHFVEAQWLPNNLLKGWIRDVSAEVAPGRTRVVEKEYSPERWTSRKKLGDMPLRLEEIPRGRFKLSMVPLDVARERMSAIPSGTLLFVVRKDFYTQPTRVTHVGIVLEKKGRLVLRHASKAPYHRVVDEPLADFFARNARYDKWPVEGVALYEIRVPEQRVERISSGGR